MIKFLFFFSTNNQMLVNNVQVYNTEFTELINGVPSDDPFFEAKTLFVYNLDIGVNFCGEYFRGNSFFRGS